MPPLHHISPGIPHSYKLSKGDGLVCVRHSGNVVYIGLVDHGRHGLVDISFAEFVQTVFVPDGFEVEPWSVELFLKELETARMGETGAALMIVFVGGEDPA
jgi:hypothetical protein